MSEQMERNAYRQLLEGITFYIDKVVSDNKEKTTTARIVSVQDDGSYTIDLDGKQYSNINTIGGTCTVNEMVKVMIPQGQYNNMFILKGGSGTGGGSTSSVTSVNGKTGNVILTASDVGALPNTTVVPTKTSELDNDSGFVVDTSYVHTDNNFTTDDKDKLDSIESGAQKNTVTGVKGSSETEYRTGNINITKENIGLGNVDNVKQWSNDNHPTTLSDYGITDGVNSTDFNTLKGRVDTNEDNIAMLDSDVEGLTTDVDTLKTDMTTVKGAVTTIQGNYVPKTRKVNGKALSTDITLGASDVKAIPTSQKGVANGVAELDANGLVPSSQLPSYVDDVLEYDTKTDFPTNGESGKIYIATDTNLQYRWTGTQYIEISSSLALGETSSTAYRGDRGKIAYDHSQKTSGNPHNVTKKDVGLSNVGNYKSVSVNANQGLTDIEKQNARNNIGAGTGSSDFSGKYDDLTGKPTLGTASSKDVPATGNANSNQVVMGNDTRLTDSRKASDVYPWAKEENKPTYTKDEIGLGNVPNVSTNNQTPTFTQNETLVNIVSGEKLSVLFGKISKAISDLISHITDKNNPHEVTKDQIGLGNVGNFKAVSTVANQGLTNNEKANARTNIGAGTSNFSGSYNDLTNKPTTFPPSEHNHDDRYYTESEIDEKLNTKVDNSAAGADSLLSKITSSWTSIPTDNTYFIRQDVGGANQFGRVRFSTLWTYIKGKLASVATSGSYNDLSDKPTFLTGGSQTTTSTVDGGTNVFTFTRSNGSESTFNVKNGSKGSNGTNGKDGVRGNTWRVGTDLTHAGDTATTTKFTSADTIIGDMYLNTQWQFVYQCIAVTSTNSTWEYLCSIKGGTLAWNSRNVNVASAEQITKSEVDGGENIYRFTLFDGSTSDLVVRNGTGVTIKTTSVTYQTSTSGTVIPTGEWHTNVPNVNKGQYLWSKTVVNYSDGKSTTTYNVGYQGTNGTNGTSAGFGTPTASVDANVGTPSVIVTASGSNTAKVFNFAFKNLKGNTGATGTRGSVINYGTAITGTSTTATAFSGSGLSSSLVNDMYINTSTFYLYRCTVAGNAANAKWVYVGSIKGTKGEKGANGVTPTIKAANGTDIGTVGTPSVTSSTSGTTTTFTFHNLKGEKGENATTTAVATESANGLMSSTDKTKINNTNVVFGVCSTTASTAAKTVSITGNTNWQLKTGAIVFVKFTTTNTASNCTLNVNGTGAKPIWYSASKYTGNSSLVCGYANRYIIFGYDGTYWVWLGFSAENNTWTAFKGATATANGTSGYVPAPTKGNQDKFFRADGTWATLSLTWNE